MTAPHNGPYGPYGPYGPPGPPPPRRTNPATIVAAVVATLVVAGLVVTLLLVKGGDDDSGGSSSAPPQGQGQQGQQGSGTATGPSPGSTDDTGALGTARNVANNALRALQPDGTASMFGFYTCKQDNARSDHGVPEPFRDGVQSFTVSDPQQAGEGEVHVRITAETANGSYGGTLVVVEENAYKACFSDSGTSIQPT